MMQPVDDVDDDNEGVDRKQLALIKRAFLALNQEKYTRTLACLSERQQHFLKLLPLLFHVNHPMFPGYVSHHTPAGVHGYSPSDEDMQIAKTISRSFTHARTLLDKHDVIDAIFIMGSTGTIAHSESSDLDVWVCHNDQVDPSTFSELNEKCHRLTQWAADTIHLEVNFFLMNAKKFSHGQQAVLSGDASGSAQHFLLLDEFYRTAIWLAGKVPLWWFVPEAQENNYSEYTNNLLNKRFLPEADVIDFGGVPEIPPNEFVGAGVWQLYKGIDSPYKSVLKLLLLEIYAIGRCKNPVSLDLKRKLYESLSHSSMKIDELDPYALIYYRIEDYLLEQKQHARLELVRRCFYFKAGKNISKGGHATAKSWQKSLLEKMVSTWGWQHHHLVHLDNRAHWKASQVLEERNLLVNELHQGHRLLMDIQKNISDNAAINNNELLILGRKLHAAFERKAGKIDWINPGISQDLSEPSLCFVQGTEEGVPVWKVHAGTQQEFLSHPHLAEPIKRSRNFIDAFLWCYCNDLFANNTIVDIVSKNFHLQLSQLQQLQQSLKQWLPLPLAKPTHETFTQNAYPTRIMLLFNIGVEPQSELLKKGMQILSSQRDALGYSGLKENLVITADIVHINSWGEVVCRHFDSDALLNCLLHYLRLIPPHKNSVLPELTVHCFSLGQAAIIEQRITHLWKSIIDCFYKKHLTHNPRFIFEIADEYVLLQFTQQQPQIFRFKLYEKLLQKLGSPQQEASVVVVDEFALRKKAIRLIYEAVKSPEVYLFYKIDGDIAHVGVVDHKGSLFMKTYPLLNAQTLLRPLYRFLRSTIERQLQMQEIDFDSPVYFKALQNINIFELIIDTIKRTMHLERREITPDISQLHFINVCAVAEPVNNLQLQFTIFCEGKEFSELEHGANLYAEVARYIFNCRKSGEMYPCYITDLDLSLCKDFIAPQTGIQLIHYMQIKDEIEQKLNVALQTIVNKP